MLAFATRLDNTCQVEDGRRPRDCRPSCNKFCLEVARAVLACKVKAEADCCMSKRTISGESKKRLQRITVNVLKFSEPRESTGGPGRQVHVAVNSTKRVGDEAYEA